SECVDVNAENLGGSVIRESLERHQKERLARPRRELADAALGRNRRCDRLLGAIYRDRIPDRREDMKEGDFGVRRRVQEVWVLDQRFERGGHVRITGALAAGEGARVATQKRKVFRNRLSCCHVEQVPPVLAATIAPSTRAVQISSAVRNPHSPWGVGTQSGVP